MPRSRLKRLLPHLSSSVGADEHCGFEPVDFLDCLGVDLGLSELVIVRLNHRRRLIQACNQQRERIANSAAGHCQRRVQFKHLSAKRGHSVSGPGEPGNHLVDCPVYHVCRVCPEPGKSRQFRRLVLCELTICCAGRAAQSLDLLGPGHLQRLHCIPDVLWQLADMVADCHRCGDESVRYWSNDIAGKQSHDLGAMFIQHGDSLGICPAHDGDHGVREVHAVPLHRLGHGGHDAAPPTQQISFETLPVAGPVYTLPRSADGHSGRRRPPPEQLRSGDEQARDASHPSEHAQCSEPRSRSAPRGDGRTDSRDRDRDGPCRTCARRESTA